SMMCMCGCRQILLQCNHVGCPVSDGMMRELRLALSRGDSDDLVVQAFVQKYGETVMAAPQASGFNLVAWVMPFAVFLSGILLVMWVARHWRLQPAGVSAESSAASRAQLQDFRERARRETEL
ncbi:MAG: cytochrome c-type biogenesis protein, partial [Terriglobales bacterium]